MNVLCISYTELTNVELNALHILFLSNSAFEKNKYGYYIILVTYIVSIEYKRNDKQTMITSILKISVSTWTNNQLDIGLFACINNFIDLPTNLNILTRSQCQAYKPCMHSFISHGYFKYKYIIKYMFSVLI